MISQLNFKKVLFVLLTFWCFSSYANTTMDCTWSEDLLSQIVFMVMDKSSSDGEVSGDKKFDEIVRKKKNEANEYDADFISSEILKNPWFVDKIVSQGHKLKKDDLKVGKDWLDGLVDYFVNPSNGMCKP